MAIGTEGGVLEALHSAASRVEEALGRLRHWGSTSEGPLPCDLVADEAAVRELVACGFQVWSEESGRHGSGEILVVVDPVDGSTNAAAGIPFFATSLAALDSSGLLAAVVVNLATKERYEALRGMGAWKGGRRLEASRVAEVSRAIVSVNGWPRRHLGWRQYRAMGAASLELCLVAEGALDGFVDCSRRGLAPWDYLGGLLLVEEAGGAACDPEERGLVVTGEAERRSVVAAGTRSLLQGLLERRGVGSIDQAPPGPSQR